MGFGFGAKNDEEDDKPKELEYNHYKTLKFKDWCELEIGMEVKSVVTGTIGSISNINKQYFLVEIDWENGKHSRCSKSDLDKVVFNKD